jgi:serine/threonine-protein kinase
LAPELTEAAPPSPQTDIYALGVVIWQGLTGVRLFEGKDELEIFMSAKRADVAPLTELRPDVPVALSALIDRTLAFDPSDRFESADQMHRVLANLLHTHDARFDSATLGRSVGEVIAYRQSGRLPR